MLLNIVYMLFRVSFTEIHDSSTCLFEASTSDNQSSSEEKPMIDSWSSINQEPYDYKFHVENLPNQPAASFSSTDKLKPKFCAICGDETNCLHYGKRWKIVESG